MTTQKPGPTARVRILVRVDMHEGDPCWSAYGWSGGAVGPSDVPTRPFYLGADLVRISGLVAYVFAFRAALLDQPWLAFFAWWAATKIYLTAWDWWWGFTGSFPARTAIGRKLRYWQARVMQLRRE